MKIKRIEWLDEENKEAILEIFNNEEYEKLTLMRENIENERFFPKYRGYNRKCRYNNRIWWIYQSGFQDYSVLEYTMDSGWTPKEFTYKTLYKYTGKKRIFNAYALLA